MPPRCYSLLILALLDVLPLVHSTLIASSSPPPSLVHTSTSDSNVIIPDHAGSPNTLSASHILIHPRSPASRYWQRRLEVLSSIGDFADHTSLSTVLATTASTKPAISIRTKTTQARMVTTTTLSSSAIAITPTRPIQPPSSSSSSISAAPLSSVASSLPSARSPLLATTKPLIPRPPSLLDLNPLPPSRTDIPRPAEKPRLLTEFEFATMWNPDPNTLRLGILLSLNSQSTQREATMVRKAISAIRMAVNEINEEQVIPGLNMSIVIRDSQDPRLYTSTGGSAAISGAGNLISAKVGGVIGDIRSDLTKYEALMTSSVQIPQCSFASASTTLSDQNTYPFFFRTIPTIIVLLDALLDVIRSMGWTRISLIYDIKALGWSGREYFSARAQKLGIYILAYQSLTTAGVPFDPTYTIVKDRIRSSQSRVQVLIATGPNQFSILHEMKEAGFFGPDYAWVTSNDISSQLRLDPDVKAFDGLIMVDNGWQLSGYTPYDEFLSKWLRLNPTDYPGAGDSNLENNEGMAYSCVMMLAHAYRDLIEQAIPDPAERTAQATLVQEIIAGDRVSDVKVSGVYTQKAYRGPSGPITLDQNGDRKEGYYVALSMQDGHPVHFGMIFSGNYTYIRKPFFKEGHPELPSDAPPWALQNPRWVNASGIIFGTLCIIGIALTIISAVLVVYFRDNIVVKASSPTFCLCELLGILLIMVWCILHIGIPRRAICIAQNFILPIGVTLLAGSLTIKNYRIYRIFNSVTVVNQAFQTRLLLRWVALALLFCMVPVIVEMAVDSPRPQTINIRSIQWVRCLGHKSQVWWVLSAGVIPAILILFGVFLAFKTRNVVFLWNEAKQISIVLYNVFFFTIIIIVSQFFPQEIYLATFYISIGGTFFVALLALTVLFVPKFWNIWKSLYRPWAENLHPSNRNHQRLSGVIGRPGSGDGGGGGGGVGTLGRMPDDFRSAPSFVRRPAGEGMGVDGGSFVQPEGDLITAERVLALVINPDASSIGGGGLSEKPSKHKRTFSVASMTLGSTIAELEGNPLGTWMNSRIPRKSSNGAAVGEKSGTSSMQFGRNTTGLEEEGPSNGFGGKEASDATATTTVNEEDQGDDSGGTRRREAPRSGGSQGSIQVGIPKEQHQTQRTNHNRVEFAEDSFDPAGGGEEVIVRQGTNTDLFEPMRTTLLAERTFGSSTSGAQRMLDCYVFLLPIRALRSRITSLLSHWCMATLILIPEAHAFLSVDSTDGRSTSYLMLSMTQVQDEQEPTIRVTACHAGTLLIRFSSQSRLDGWMDLFTEQDLQALAARTASTSSSESYPPYMTGYNGNLLGGANGGVSGMRRRSMTPEPFGQDFINPHGFSFFDPLSGGNGVGSRGGGSNSDMMTMMNGNNSGTGLQGQGQGIISGNRGNGPSPSDDESQQRASWTSRFGTGFSRFWLRKESSKSTSGAGSQTATYDICNLDHPVNHPRYNGDVIGRGRTVDEDGFATSGGSRAGGEWSSTDSNLPNSGFVGRRSRRPMKYQSPFGSASEIVVENQEGEAESPERAIQAAAAAATASATPRIEMTPLEEQSLANVIDAPPPSDGTGDDNRSADAGYGDLTQSQRRGSSGSGRFGETLPPPMLDFNPPTCPTSMHAPSVHSYQGSDRSVARSGATPTEDDDEALDDLYDPEFGIGGNGRRRRNRPKLPNRFLTTQANPAAIPSAAVISAAAAAVSAGWSESDALAVAIASPGLIPIAPRSVGGSGGSGGGGLTLATPEISPNGSSPRNNEARVRHDSRASMTSNFRTSQYFHRGIAGESYLSSGSSNSVHSNQGAPAAGSMASIVANVGVAGSEGGGKGDGSYDGGGNEHMRRVSTMSPFNNSQTKRFSASAQMILSPATTPSSPIASTLASQVRSSSSAVAPLATFPTGTDVNNNTNSPIEPQVQPQ